MNIPLDAFDGNVDSLKTVFKSECKHQEEFKLGEFGRRCGDKPFDWRKCDGCACVSIPFKVPFDGNGSGFIFRDVCFAFWHDYIELKL